MERLSLADLRMGLERAADRLEQALSVWDHPYISLFEALNWCVSIQDRLNEIDSDHPDRAWVEDPWLSGFRFVRNRVHHQWSRALSLEALWPGFEQVAPPDQYPGRTENLLSGGWRYLWVPADQLPPTTAKNPLKRQWDWNGRMNYETFVRLGGVVDGFRHVVMIATVVDATPGRLDGADV